MVSFVDRWRHRPHLATRYPPIPRFEVRLITFGALLLLLAAGSGAGEVLVHPTPVPSMLAELQRRHHPGDWLRVTTGSTRVVTRAERLDAQGLSGLTLRRDERAPSDPLPWERIARIDKQTDRHTYGRIMGAIFGGVGGVLIPAIPSGYDQTAPMSPRNWFLGGAVVGAVAGHMLGSRVMRERALYVAPTPVRELPLAAAPPVVVAVSGSDSVAAASPGEAASATPILTPPPAATATPSSFVSDPLIERALHRFNSGDLLRIEGDFGRFHGYASAAGPQGLEGLRPEPSLESVAELQSIPWQRINRIDKRGGSAGRGAIRGGLGMGLSVGVLTSLVAAALVSAFGGSANLGDLVLVGLGGAAVGGGVGALFGAAIGAGVASWHTVYLKP